ncbi:hypothetical protein H257_16045 [Aphanomyces astaci]|uniref:Uncharacterized protein n=1 Tax=Aphanomyces astaci TaxID=112090 RepID=W4FM77_APHAT|nr:hypothetical protein H257_16045 [Aphanomyces astaci]ETV67808.1 hypothetical protein H257_16045 [Aphanomyces astaci]|eukprot:XP_009842666.1 hypothetical protein H257_16045 [Aphanomyces astaci]
METVSTLRFDFGGTSRLACRVNVKSTTLSTRSRIPAYVCVDISATTMASLGVRAPTWLPRPLCSLPMSWSQQGPQGSTGTEALSKIMFASSPRTRFKCVPSSLQCSLVHIHPLRDPNSKRHSTALSHMQLSLPLGQPRMHGINGLPVTFGSGCFNPCGHSASK